MNTNVLGLKVLIKLVQSFFYFCSYGEVTGKEDLME